jgi:menaquinone-specific isochorismate synthase
MVQLVPVTTTRLGEHLPLLDLLPDTQPLAWVRSGEGLVGWGTYATTTVSGPHRFADARHWWQKQLEKLAVNNTVHGSGTGPVLFTSFSFSPEDVSVLVIPQVVVGTKSGKSWITWIGSDSQPDLKTTPDHFSNGEMKWDEQPLANALWTQ